MTRPLHAFHDNGFFYQHMCYSILVNLYCTISGSEQTETAIMGLGLSLEDTLELLYQHVTKRIHLSLTATKDTVNYS